MDEGRLAALLGNEPFVARLIVLEAVDSTNAYARSLGADAPEGTVVVADRQTSGRGSRGRSWASPAGVGLYISVLLRPRIAAAALGQWTLLGAVAGCRACRCLGAGGVAIAWPNDLVVGRRKLGGVLVEARSAGADVVDIVLGTGVNVGQQESDFPPELAGRATSLRMETTDPPAREVLAARYLAELARFEKRLREGDGAELQREWERLAPGAHGRAVRVRAAGTAYVGRTDGLAPGGGLRVRRDSGGMEVVQMAESVEALD